MEKEQIRLNRERIRKNMQGCFVTPHKLGMKCKDIMDIKKIQQESLNRTRVRRKTSQDIRILNDVGYLKQIYISNSFSDLFEILQPIGSGAQSVVYTCRQIDTQKIYAVKVIKKQDSQLFRTMKQQYRILKTLHHENILKAYYMFINQNQSTSYMVCQYCPYGNLRQYLQKNKLKEIQVADILTTILNTVVYLHQRRICHRDLKLDNILYDRVTGNLKIIDFQIAKMAKYQHERLQMWTQTGTLCYKAPQMFEGNYNESVDIWAVGVMAYEMLFRKLPFSKEYVKDTIEMIKNQEPDYSNSNITASFLDFIKRLLHKNPLERLTARQSLKSPFLLKYASVSSSASSPRLKTNGSQDDDKKQKDFMLDITRCYDQHSQINGKSSFSEDIGIRFCSASRIN